MSTDTHTRQIIVRLLSNMAGAKEIQQYLERFSNLDTNRFAVVKVGGAVIGDELEQLASSLSFLERVGLIPIVIHGAGPQLDAALAEAGIEKQVRDGMRVTPPEVLRIVRRVTMNENLRLVEAIQALGANAQSITGGVFEAEFLSEEDYGFVGRVTSVNLEPVRTALAAGSMPVLCSLAETAYGQILNVNADLVANKLVGAVKPYKVIFLTSTGGLLDQHGELIPNISLGTDYELLMAQEWVHSGMRLKLRQIHDLLRQLPLSSSVSITRPAELAKELFTHRGSGTLLKCGEPIGTFQEWRHVDLERLRETLESGFGGHLASDYFDTLPLHAAYISESYRAAAILAEEDGVLRLDKFAVVGGARGEGLGRTVWNEMRGRHPRLMWRAQPRNKINGFYFQECEGCVKTPQWNLYWYGYDDIADTRPHIASLCARAPTMSYDERADAS